MKGNCLLILPALESAENRMRQTDAKEILKHAIKQADLTMLEEKPDGMVVTDITPELIQYMEEVEFVVMDLDSYGGTGEFSYSPVLFYLLALRHASKKPAPTILTARSADALPNSLRNYVITYSETTPLQLFKLLKERVEKLRAGAFSPCDPVNAYRQRQEYERTQEELRMTQVQLQKLEAERKASAQRSRQRIEFRKLD